MRLRAIIFFLMAALVACSTTSIRAEFDNSFEFYNGLIRGQDFDRTKLFSYDPTSPEFVRRLDAAKKARVVDYNIQDVKYDERLKKHWQQLSSVTIL